MIAPKDFRRRDKRYLIFWQTSIGEHGVLVKKKTGLPIQKTHQYLVPFKRPEGTVAPRQFWRGDPGEEIKIVIAKLAVQSGNYTALRSPGSRALFTVAAAMMGADKVAIPTLSLMNRKRKPCYATAIILVDWPNSDLNPSRGFAAYFAIALPFAVYPLSSRLFQQPLKPTFDSH